MINTVSDMLKTLHRKLTSATVPFFSPVEIVTVKFLFFSFFLTLPVVNRSKETSYFFYFFVSKMRWSGLLLDKLCTLNFTL